MQRRELPSFGRDGETKDRILEEAAKLIALRGFGDVSMRDIAQAAGIQTSTIYYYYRSKNILLEDVLSRFEAIYRDYTSRMGAANRTATTLEELMDNIINLDWAEMLNPMFSLGMSIALKMQHSQVSARGRVFELFFSLSVSQVQADLDRLIERGVIPPSDTKTLSTAFMFFVIGCNDLYIHESMGAKTPMDCLELFRNLKKCMTLMLKKGA